MYVTSGEKGEGGYDANFIVEYLVIMWLQKRRKVDTWEVGGRRVPWREVTVKDAVLQRYDNKLHMKYLQERKTIRINLTL